MRVKELHHLSREELIETILRLHAHSIYLEEQLTLLKKALFGKKSEKQLPYVDSQQQVLDLDVLSYESHVEKKEEVHYTRKKISHQVKGHGRNPLPSHLKVEEEVLEPAEKTEEMEKIGEEVSEKIDYKPSEFIIKRIIRPKYKDRETEKIYIAPLPGGPFEKSIAGSGLIAHVNIQKYVDHLPLYRQQQQFRRQGLEISLSTMSDWVRQTAELVEPLYERLKEEVLSGGYVMADETPIRVQDRTKRGETHRGYYWVYYSPERRLVFFDYRNGRGRAGPEEILHNYHGILQTDGWTGYESLHAREDIFSVGCMAHARRKFVDAHMHHKKLSNEILGKIQKLYFIERFSRTMNLTVEERYRLRQENAVPILKEIRSWLDYQLTHPTYTPKSTFGQAIQYMHHQWDRLAAYCENGRIEIDNNLVENAIRPIALGRKNYLFAGSHEGAKRAAIIYSLVSSAKLQGIDSFQYLKTILDILPEHSIKRLHELLPGSDIISTLI